MISSTTSLNIMHTSSILLMRFAWMNQCHDSMGKVVIGSIMVYPCMSPLTTSLRMDAKFRMLFVDDRILTIKLGFSQYLMVQEGAPTVM